MEKLKTIPLDQIDPSPYRDLNRFPLREDAVASLVDKMEKNGVLPGTGGACARPKADGRYELAYGHHRLEAMRRCNFADAHILVDDLDEDQMVVFLAMENDDLRNSGFLAQYESWLAAKSLISLNTPDGVSDMAVAEKLGWVRDHPQNKGKYALTKKAEICAGFERLEAADVVDVSKVRDWTITKTRDFVAEQRAAQMEAEKRATALEKAEREEDAHRERERAKAAGKRMVDRVNNDEIHTAADLKQEMRQERQRLARTSELGDSEVIQREKDAARERFEKEQRAKAKMPDAADIMSKLTKSVKQMLPPVGSEQDGIGQMCAAMEHILSDGNQDTVETLIAELDRLATRAGEQAKQLREAVRQSTPNAAEVVYLPR